MDNLFDYITNIKKQDILKEVKDSISEESKILNDFGVNQLCKVYSSNIEVNLKNKNIKCHKYNLQSDFGIDHEIVIANLYLEGKDTKLVIDATFKQFFNNEINNDFYNELIKNKYFIVNESNLTEYFNLFNKLKTIKDKNKSTQKNK